MFQSISSDSSLHYSFRNSFKSYSLFKKFLVVVIFPFLPIYTISKYFQVKGRRKGKNPRLFLYMTILFLIYFFTIYPLALSLTWLVLQIYLFPLSILAALYLHKYGFKGFEEDESFFVDERSNPFLFELQGFVKHSKSFVFVVLLAIFFSFFGLMFFFGFIALIFISFPVIYKKLGFIPRWGLILANPIFGFLSYIPGVNMRGKWFIEENSEKKRLSGIPDIIQFVFGNWQPFFIVNVGIIALTIRIMIFLRGDTIPAGSLLSTDVLSSWGFFFIFAVVPIIMVFYFITVWVWDDAELKVALTKKSSKGFDQNNKRVEETVQLLPAADSIKSLFTLAFGIPAVFWFVDESARRDSDYASGTIGLVVMIIVFFIAFGGVVIFMGVMYYRSGAHEYLVNNLRDHIRTRNIYEPDDNVLICYSSVRPIILNPDV